MFGLHEFKSYICGKITINLYNNFEKYITIVIALTTIKSLNINNFY